VGARAAGQTEMQCAGLSRERAQLSYGGPAKIGEVVTHKSRRGRNLKGGTGTAKNKARGKCVWRLEKHLSLFSGGEEGDHRRVSRNR